MNPLTQTETPVERDPGYIDVTEQTFPDLAVVEAVRAHVRRQWRDAPVDAA